MKFLSKAIKTAHASSHGDFKHGALLVKGGSLLASGFNHGRIHAEKCAISKVWPSKVRGSILINVRITKTGFGRSAPCRKCHEMLRVLGVKSVIFYDGRGWRKERI